MRFLSREVELFGALRADIISDVLIDFLLSSWSDGVPLLSFLLETGVSRKDGCLAGFINSFPTLTRAYLTPPVKDVAEAATRDSFGEGIEFGGLLFPAKRCIMLGRAGSSHRL